MRCYFFFTESEWSNEFYVKQNDKEYKRISEDYVSAKNFLLTFIPKPCKATINLSFDTLSYIVRHTQKKPRQLIFIFNAILDKIVKTNNINYYLEYESELKKQIHIVQYDLLSDSLNMYAETYTGIFEVCAQILNGQLYKISNSELDDIIKKSDLGEFRNQKDTIKRILIESGIIGTCDENDVRYIAEQNPWFQNPNIIKIMPTLFEYQKKGKLFYNYESEFILHPMCYEYYRSQIDYNCLVYPECYDNTDETFKYFSMLKDE